MSLMAAAYTFTAPCDMEAGCAVCGAAAEQAGRIGSASAIRRNMDMVL